MYWDYFDHLCTTLTYYQPGSIVFRKGSLWKLMDHVFGIDMVLIVVDQSRCRRCHFQLVSVICSESNHQTLALTLTLLMIYAAQRDKEKGQGHRVRKAGGGDIEHKHALETSAAAASIDLYRRFCARPPGKSYQRRLLQLLRRLHGMELK